MKAFGIAAEDATTNLNLLAVVSLANGRHVTLLCDRGVTLELRIVLEWWPEREVIPVHSTNASMITCNYECSLDVSSQSIPINVPLFVHSLVK